MNVPANLKYTKDHEWLKVNGEEALVGITDFAQHELGDIVFVEVETVGENLAQHESFGTIEAVKTVSDMFMPVAGEILEFNELLTTNPETINKDPYEKGWVIRIRIANPGEIAGLLDAGQYAAQNGA
ncbi:MAG: glycine cleavage system protein GcvH [Alphaproteobacteria bacterium]|nr:glycine cleavage system protein GcvH [Alphaproteobacteria bacterium]